MDENIRAINVDNAFYGSPVYYVEETPSTMIVARNLAAGTDAWAGCPSGTVIAAGYQSSGRGRVPGRVWQSRRGENLTFTLILRENDTLIGDFPLSLAAGLGLAFFLEESFDLRPEIKWPNDILVGGRKISGILIERKRGVYLAGIGLNVNQVSFSGDIESKATSVKAETGMTSDPHVLLADVLKSLKKAFLCEDHKDEIERRLYRRNGNVLFLPGDPRSGKSVDAVIAGIGENGALILKDSSGNMIESSSGEVVF